MNENIKMMKKQKNEWEDRPMDYSLTDAVLYWLYFIVTNCNSLLIQLVVVQMTLGRVCSLKCQCP